MIEEAAGTSMYESKRDDTAKLIEKKDTKIKEISEVRITSTLASYRRPNFNYAFWRWILIKIL